MKSKFSLLFVPLAVLALAAPTLAGPGHDHGKGDGHGHDHAAMDEQTAMQNQMKAMTPGDAHQSLASMAGTWKTTIQAWVDPSAPPMEMTGTSRKTMIMGGRFLKEEFEGEVMGMTMHGMGVTGYNNVTGAFEQMWLDNMATSMGTGTAKMEGNKMVGFMNYTDPKGWTTGKAKTVMSIQDDNTHVFTWYEKQKGKEVKTMEITYKRATGS